MAPTKIDIRIERRLRRFIEREGRARESYLYHLCCGPSYLWNRDQFQELLAKLILEEVCELVSSGNHKAWVVRKDFVAETVQPGVLP